MKKFHYKAKKGLSEIVEGTVVAEDKDNAIDKVNDLGLIPVDVYEEKKTKIVSAVKAKNNTEKPVSKKIKSRDLLIFYRQLAKLMKAGVPLLQGLYLMSQENESPGVKAILDALYKDVREGNHLSAAMSVFPGAFSKFDLAMVQTGEASGKLDEVLLQVADYRETQRELASKVRSALAYPCLIVAMGIFTVYYMLTNVIPNFARFFEDLGQNLPLATRILMFVSDWFQTMSVFLISGVVGLFFLFRHLLGDPERRVKFDGFLLGVPLLGKVLLKAEISRLCRTLELLLKSGIPMLKAIQFVLPVLRNQALRKELEKCGTLLQEGSYFSEGLRQSKYFPQFVSYFIGVGEESGKLEESLQEIADWYEKDTAEAIKIMTSLLEPAIILIVGGILAVIIMAILLPVFSINAMVG